jgi:hypothetical protein
MDPYFLFWMSDMEKKEIKWDKNMEDEFLGFIFGIVRFRIQNWQEKKSSHGIMTIIATPE